MTFNATLTANGKSYQITRAGIVLPRWGIWTAELALDVGEVELTGPVTLTVGAQVLKGTIRRGGAFVGASSQRVYAGADGWAKTIPRASAQGPLAKLSRVAQDAARLVGETVVLEPGAERTVGPYARKEAPASRVLSQLSPEAWWVETDGVTHVGARAASSVAPRVLDYCPSEGRARVSEDALLMLPGQTVAVGDETKTIATVELNLCGGAFNQELWFADGSTTVDRFAAAIRGIVRETTPRADYWGVYEYRVTKVAGSSYELAATDTTAGYPDLAQVRVRPGVPGISSALAIGCLVLVQQINGDPSRPFIASVAGPDDAGFTPTTLAIACSGLIALGGEDTPSLGGDPGRFLRSGDTLEMTIHTAQLDTPTPTPVFLAASSARSTVKAG